MNTHRIIRLLLAVVLLAAASAQAAMPVMPEIPDSLPDAVQEKLLTKYRPLSQKKFALIQEGEANRQQCTNVVQDSPQHRSCLAKLQEFNARVEALRVEVGKLSDEIDAEVVAESNRIIKAMNAHASQLGWSTDKQARLSSSLRKLGLENYPEATDAQIRKAWQGILDRGQREDFVREAAQVDGLKFPGAGEQKDNYDCAIFALANATGLPYGVVAARATKLITEGGWHSAADQANPQKLIERKGLNGGEVVMLAEVLGQAEVVRSSDFAKTLKKGRPVLVNVIPEGGEGGHEVVLTKSFQRGEEIWYEMMDSRQGPLRRLYLNDTELKTILQENGVAFRSEPGTVPKLLR